MSGALSILVRQGAVHVNSVVEVSSSARHRVLAIDCRAKRCEVLDVIVGSEIIVSLDAGPETLYAEENRPATQVRISCDGDWHAEATPGRYTVFVVMWRQNDRARELWADDDGLTTGEGPG